MSVYSKNFKHQLIWQKSLELVQEIYALTRQLDITKQKNLITQLRNNVDALHSNIALSLIKIYSNSYNDIILQSLDLCDNLRVQILFLLKEQYVTEIMAKDKLENEIVEETKFEEAEAETKADAEVKEEPIKEAVQEQKAEDTNSKEEVQEKAEEQEVVVEEDLPAGKDLVTVEEQSAEEVAEIKAKEEEIPNPTERILIAGIEYSVEDLEKLVKDFNELSTKYSTLQANVHSEKVEGLFNKYSNVLDKEDVAELKADASKLSIEDLETKIFAVIGRKSFSAKKVEQEQPEYSISQIKLSTGKFSTGNKLDDLVNKL